jgi:hypothetical protein
MPVKDNMKIIIKDTAHFSLDGYNVHKYAAGTILEATSGHHKAVFTSLIKTGVAVEATEVEQATDEDAPKVRKVKETK